MDCEKKCKIKRVGALMGRWKVDCKKSTKLRGLGHQGAVGRWIAKKKCKINRVGALKGRWRVDCKKKCKIKRVGTLRYRLQKKSGKLKRVGASSGG